MDATRLGSEPQKVAVTIAISKCFRIHRSWGTSAFIRNSSFFICHHKEGMNKREVEMFRTEHKF